jgi:putative transposase
MARRRYKEEQIIRILKELETGISAAEISRKYGISATSFYKWKQKFGDMTVSDARKLKSLENENKRLKRIVADQVLDIQVLKEINSGNF